MVYSVMHGWVGRTKEGRLVERVGRLENERIGGPAPANDMTAVQMSASRKKNRYKKRKIIARRARIRLAAS